jgi:hypothetical protein
MLNSVLNFIENFVSMANVEIYHVPGELNICADVFSRAISENLNCNIQRLHPISKKWAAVIPPIADNFSVDNETLFKFLTTPLKPEREDIYNRAQCRLAEPCSTQTWFDLTSKACSEERFNEALNILKNWNINYTRNHRLIKEINSDLVDNDRRLNQEVQKAQDNLDKELRNGSELKGEISSDGIKIAYKLAAGSYLQPMLNELENLEIPLQTTVH